MIKFSRNKDFLSGLVSMTIHDKIQGLCVIVDCAVEILLLLGKYDYILIQDHQSFKQANPPNKMICRYIPTDESHSTQNHRLVLHASRALHHIGQCMI